jgi:hypothetical protein
MIHPIIHHIDGRLTERAFGDLLEEIAEKHELKPGLMLVSPKGKRHMAGFSGTSTIFKETTKYSASGAIISESKSSIEMYRSDFNSLVVEISQTIPSDRIEVYSGPTLLGVIHGFNY